MKKENNGVQKVAVYCRIGNASGEQSGFDLQTQHYKNSIKNNPELELYAIYKDIGAGTSVKNRPQFREMIRDALDGNFNLIITKSVSRFARNTMDCLKCVRQLKEKGVAVYFEKEGINTLNDKDSVIFDILAQFGG